MITLERRRQLTSFWLEEDDFPGEWRKGLSREERELVESWDRKHSSSAYQLCLDILQTGL